MDLWRDIRRQARAARALLGPNAATAPAQEVLDALLRLWDLQLDSISPDHPLLRGARAAWREEYGLALVDCTLPAPERAFAVAHELGHRVCHPGGCTCDDADIDDATMPIILPLGEGTHAGGRVWGYNPRQAREVEANVFAGELLAPAAELRARFMAGATYRDLAEGYGVTPACILNGLVGAVLGGTATEPVADQDALDMPLDVSQRRAAETTARRVLVDAGPGTGKTRTLVGRALHLLRTSAASASEILVLTFSNRAAAELRERLRRSTPEAAGVTVATFHGFALDALRRFAPRAGLPDDFRVVDDVDAAMLLEAALPGLGLEQYARLSRPALYLPSLLEACSRMRDELLTPQDVAAAMHAAGDEAEDGVERAQRGETLRLLVAYEDLLAAHGLIDYGGLIARTVQLLRSDEAVATALRGEVRHVLVDEYQDVNHAGAVLLRELVRGGTALWVVGDVRQSIYRFRGAEPRNVSDFEADFPDGVRLTLEVNYRAVPGLVETLAGAAEALTGAAAAWRAQRRDAVEDAVVLAIAPDDASERAGLAADVARSMAAGRRPEDHAVLCRTHRQAAEIAAALSVAGLPASYLGDFFLRPEIKDLLALLDLCHGPDGSSLLRLATWPEYRLPEEQAVHLIRTASARALPFPAALQDREGTAGLPAGAKAALARLSAHVEAVRFYPDPASVLLHFLFGEAPYLRRLLRDGSARAGQAASAIFQLVILARGFMARPPTEPDGGTTRAFLRYVRRLLADGDAGVAQAGAAVPGAVNVMTVHASKGLEFPVVYVPNLAAGRFPPRARGGVRVALPPALQLGAESAGDDERSLFFVAISRATDRLVLSRAARYGGRAGRESELLHALRGTGAPREIAWPRADLAGDVTPDAMAVSAVSAPAHHVELVARCPAQYRYRDRLGLHGDDAAHGYHSFAGLLRAGVGQLRTAHGTEAWPPSWNDAAVRFAASWNASWPPDHTLGPWYRSAALRALERVYRDIDAQGIAPSARYGEEYAVDLEGCGVSVRVDAVEEIDGVPRLIWERATRRSDDATALRVALYAAAAQAISPQRPAPVAIRYLDSGETRDVPDAARVLDRHRARIRAALSWIGQETFPASPAAGDECTRCPLVFVCPR